MKPFIIKEKIKVGIIEERLNRFVALVKISRQIYRCHLPNPGRMTELFNFGETRVCVVLDLDNHRRKTDGTVIAVLFDDQVINLDTNLFSDLLEFGIKNNALSLFKTWNIIKREHTIDNHRFDFLFEVGGYETISEVKSTTRVVNRIACFPDAVSKRATKHLEKLGRLQKNNYHVMLIFMVFRSAEALRPCYQIDPKFGEIFDKLRDRIQMYAIQILGSWSNNQEIKYKFEKEIPII